MAGLKDTLKRTQRMKYEAITRGIGLAEDLRRVQTRAKYFVDLLNVLSKEPFSRRKREAFFKNMRVGGIDASLVAYEQKYGNLLESYLTKSERATAVAIHQDMAEEVRDHFFEENRALLEATKTK